MSVSSPFIHRPIATSLLGLATVLGGALGYFNLPVSSLPQVDFPTIQVTTQLPGANPQTMSTLVTASLERAARPDPRALHDDLDERRMASARSRYSSTSDRDIDAAAQDVQSAINAAGSHAAAQSALSADLLEGQSGRRRRSSRSRSRRIRSRCADLSDARRHAHAPSG